MQSMLEHLLPVHPDDADVVLRGGDGARGEQQLDEVDELGGLAEGATVTCRTGASPLPITTIQRLPRV